MTRDAMDRLIGEELEHIPKYPKPLQSLLRTFYQTKRLCSLGPNAIGNPTAFDVLQECILAVRVNCPDAEVLYDREFFEGAAAGA